MNSDSGPERTISLRIMAILLLGMVISEASVGNWFWASLIALAIGQVFLALACEVWWKDRPYRKARRQARAMLNLK